MKKENYFPLHVVNAVPGDNQVVAITITIEQNELGNVEPHIEREFIPGGKQGIIYCPRSDGMIVLAKGTEADALLAGMFEAVRFMKGPRMKQKTRLGHLAGFVIGKAKNFFSK